MSAVLSSREAEEGKHSHSEVSGQLEQEDKTLSPQGTSGKSLCKACSSARATNADTDCDITE